MFKSNYSTIKCGNCGEVSKLKRLSGTRYSALFSIIMTIAAMIIGHLFELPIALTGLLALFIINYGFIYFYDDKYFKIMH